MYKLYNTVIIRCTCILTLTQRRSRALAVLHSRYAAHACFRLVYIECGLRDSDLRRSLPPFPLGHWQPSSLTLTLSLSLLSCLSSSSSTLCATRAKTHVPSSTYYVVYTTQTHFTSAVLPCPRRRLHNSPVGGWVGWPSLHFTLASYSYSCAAHPSLHSPLLPLPRILSFLAVIYSLWSFSSLWM